MSEFPSSEAEQATPTPEFERVDQDTKDKISEILRQGAKLKDYGEDTLGFLQDVATFVFQILKKENKSDEWLRTRKFRQTVADLFTEGSTSFMNSCFEYTAVASKVLEAGGAKDIKLKVLQLENGKYHFALEFLLNGELYHLDFSHQNNVTFGPGKVQPSYDSLVKFDIAIPAHNITAETNLEKFAEFFHIPSEVFDAHRDKLAKDNK